MWHGKVSRHRISHAGCPVLAVPPATARGICLGPAGWALRHRELTLDWALRDWDAADSLRRPQKENPYTLSPATQASPGGSGTISLR
jgi:hypothetical protein